METPLLYSIAAVSLDFTWFPELHPSCLLDLKGKNAYTGIYRESIFEVNFELKIGGVELTELITGIFDRVEETGWI